MRARASQTSGGKARKMIFVQFWGRDALPLPRPAFTARSLVGMTMGSRKRAALASKAPASLAVRWRMFRIGERLRPCPGCETRATALRRYHKIKCGTCGASGVRLWRPYGNNYRERDNICTACAPSVDLSTGRPPWYVQLVLGKRGTIWGHFAGSRRDWQIFEALPVVATDGPCQTCGAGVLPARKTKR